MIKTGVINDKPTLKGTNHDSEDFDEKNTYLYKQSFILHLFYDQSMHLLIILHIYILKKKKEKINWSTTLYVRKMLDVLNIFFLLITVF